LNVTSIGMLKKREIFEWALIAGVMGVIYFGGWQAEVGGFLQRGLLLTGFMNPDHDNTSEVVKAASYNLSLVTLDGQRLPPNALKNKVVFMNIWATWCPPCVAEMPGIHQLYQSVNQDEIVFLMLSVDDNMDKLRRFMERKGYTFPVYLSAAPLPEMYQTSSIPTTFVISPEGKIVFKEEGMANYDTEDFRQFLYSQKKTDTLGNKTLLHTKRAK
jgi:thiol-disulfide isomerase/thioredoxin